MLIHIAFYESFRDNEPACVETTWEELAETLTTFAEPGCAILGTSLGLPVCAGRDCSAKDGPAWSPVDIADRRADVNVRSVTAMVLDLDHVPDLAPVLAACDGFTYVLHSTHSHSKSDPCYRLVLPLSRPCAPAEWPRVRAAVVRALDLPADPATKDLSRIYFLPTPRGGVPPYIARGEGEPIDVDEALALDGAPPPAAPPAPAGPVDLAALRDHLSRARRSKAQGDDRLKGQADILGRVLEGRALAEPGARDATTLRAAGLLAYWLPLGTTWEAAGELLRPSLSAMDTAPEGLEHWMGVVEKQYDRAARARATKEAQRASENETLAELAKSVRDRSGVKPGDDDVEDWQSLLIVDRKDGIKICEHNARLIMACAPELAGTLRFNTVLKRAEILGGPMAGVPEDHVGVALAGWLQRHYEFYGGARLIQSVIPQVAFENTYDPIAEFLEELAWDGVARLDGFLEKYFGVEGDPAYVRPVSRKWLISLVARALSPGCKVDTVLILEGAQGLGKSSALEALVGAEYFLDTALALGEKDTMQAIASAWLVELGELASLRRAEQDRIKQFLTSKVDKFRQPYGHTTIAAPRRCIFAGSTDVDDYLRDYAGNRRYWPVKVKRPPDVAGIRRDRGLILAEAVAAYVAGEPWHLVGQEVELARAETAERMGASPVAETISQWWYSLAPDKRPRRFTLSNAAEMALKLGADRLEHGLKTALGIALTDVGFKRVRLMNRGVRSFWYEPTEEMLGAPVQTSAARQAGISLVQSVKAAKKEGK